MLLDKVIIGERIRKLREETFKETRKLFAKRCDLTERCIGQIERGEFLLGLKTLDKIATATGIDTDYILYGKGKNNSTIRKALQTIIDRTDDDQVEMLYRCISIAMKYEADKYKK